MKKIKGDLIRLAKQGEFDVIIHGCNCFCTMGAGLAVGIKKEFREAYEADLKTIKGDKSKLGTYSRADIIRGDQRLIVLNAYTQYNYGGSGILADYDAINSVFRLITLDFEGLRIGVPMIGAGLARGDWPTIEAIIKNNLGGMCDFTIVEFDQ